MEDLCVLMCLCRTVGEEGGVEDLCVLVCLFRTGMGREVWRIYVYWCVCSGQG